MNVKTKPCAECNVIQPPKCFKGDSPVCIKCKTDADKKGKK